MRAHFNIYGLPLELSADHPLLFEAIAEDLRFFQVKPATANPKTIHLQLTALPLNGETHPLPFLPYRENTSRRFKNRQTLVIWYGRSLITVITDFKKRRILAGVVPDPSLLPDPAYHLCFSQPVSPWLKERGLFAIHAGCVSADSKGILIIGPRRAGKSTLSVSAVRRDFRYLSDELPLLTMDKDRLKALAFPRRIRLNRPVITLVPELHPLLESSALERIAFSILQIWPGSLTSSCEPQVLLFPRFHKRGRLRLSRISSTAALARLLQDDHFVWYRNGPWKRLSQQHLSLFERLVLQAKAYELHYGTQDILRIPDLFHRLLRD